EVIDTDLRPLQNLRLNPAPDKRCSAERLHAFRYCGLIIKQVPVTGQALLSQHVSPQIPVSLVQSTANERVVHSASFMQRYLQGFKGYSTYSCK
ncbi:MAG: hypothetical protein JXR25_16150, partial [Pontiellaceae bacterium]|nr:hypothetical protein [Pontiellaceae bacterium]MBN2786353.1 hypothetical protein [Pontiellaceae bacterium]